MRWLRKDNLIFVKWKDSKEVSMCSTFHKAYSGKTTRRRVKEAGQWSFKSIPIPDVIKDYNQHMGGVDLSDALIQYYSVRGKTMRWYKTLFYHFVDIAIVNAYIISKQLADEYSRTSITQKRFRENLIKEMIEEAKATSVAPACSATPDFSSTCIPLFFGATATSLRRVCVVCKNQGRKVKTPVYCSKCSVALCLTSTRNCFAQYHVNR